MLNSRLAGVALLALVVNYWWPGFPANLSTEAYNEQYQEDQWALQVSHYAPWLMYWSNTQKLFQSCGVASGRSKFSHQDYEIFSKLVAIGKQKDRVLSKESALEMPRSNTGVDLMNCSSDNSLYQEGEKVWAFYGGKWYQAKVQKVESRMSARTHFVHYLGWNKRWDEWLGTERLMKFTDEDVHNQLAKNTKSGHKRKEKQSDEILLSEENMNIELPRMLKKQLVNDCEFVTHLGKLVKLPRTPNVDDILKKYFTFKVKRNNKLSDEIQEILNGIRCYFDKALPAILLYNSERKQYEALSGENIPPSLAYGAEHLLRLFVKLPEMLHAVKIEEETRKLQREILGLLKFLEKNQSTFFLSTYQTPEYLEAEKK
ncbi:Chromatin modification-related protein eaf3 [Heracleum sosnowskyi]|uniref:Chromatin modification-related protein eaf3 n=1 Tax=Heracleum sosnowskyi TaxID=360622 RepID=A0AAD8IXZ9_9APIA|nr:Chromatin modification-related protein eaf3 [Heracleum sosnowskyi]